MIVVRTSKLTAVAAVDVGRGVGHIGVPLTAMLYGKIAETLAGIEAVG